MDPSQFDKRAGTVALSSNGAYHTFTPKPMPVSINIDNEMFKLLEEATLKIGNLNRVGRQFPNPYLLVDPFLKKEAVESSMIEGTQSSLSDVLLFEAKDSLLKTSSGDLKEVVNSINATKEGIRQINKEKELNLQLMLSLHKILLTGVRGREKSPGELRIVQNWIGRPGSTPSNARYVPPQPEKIAPLLANLFDYLNNSKDLPDLAKIAIIHYQFEAIHPFKDGNGRIGRLLILLYLLRQKILDLPLLYISEFFENYRGSYYDLLMNVSRKGEYEAWLKFFLNAISIQADDAASKINALFEFIGRNDPTVEEACGGAGKAILSSLLSNPYTTVTRASRAANISYPTSEKILAKLVSLGILRQVKAQHRNRIFVCDPIIKILKPE